MTANVQGFYVSLWAAMDRIALAASVLGLTAFPLVASATAIALTGTVPMPMVATGLDVSALTATVVVAAAVVVAHALV